MNSRHIRSYGTFAALLAITTVSLYGQNPQVTADFSVNNGTGSPLVFGLSGSVVQDTVQTSYDSQNSGGVTIIRTGLHIPKLFQASRFPVANAADDASTLAAYVAAMNAGSQPGSLADPATWDWSSWTTAGALYRQQGLKIMVATTYCPLWLAWYPDPGGWGVPKNWLVWQDIVTKVYKHLNGSLDYAEIWNEPDNFIDDPVGDGSPYAGDKLAAYKDLYYYTATAIRLANQTIPIGGPVVGFGDSQTPGIEYASTILGDSRNHGNVNFLDYHDYSFTTNEDKTWVANYKAEGAQYGLSNIPVFITEWNYGSTPYPNYNPGQPISNTNPQYINGPLNGAAPNAVSFVGRRLSDMLNGQLTGSMIYVDPPSGCPTSGQFAGDCFEFLDTNENLLPKSWTYRLLSKDLRLGSGTSTLASASTVTQLAATGAAKTADGNLAAWLVNDSSSPTTVDLVAKGLTGSAGKATVYLASDQSTAVDASAPFSTQTINVVSGQSTLTNLAIPAYSVMGVLLDGVNGTPPGAKSEAENLPESNTSGVTYSINSNSSASNGAFGQLYSTQVGQYVQYTVGGIVQGTTYHVIVGYKTNGDRGQTRLTINGNAQPQTSILDQFSYTESFTSADLGTFYAGSAGSTRTFTFTVSGKNPTSAGYGVSIDYITLIPM